MSSRSTAVSARSTPCTVRLDKRKDVKKMADEKKKVTEKQGFFSKVSAFFKNLPAIIAKPFKNMWHELKKVTWPTRKEWLNCTLIVLAFMVFMGLVIGLLDLGASKLVQLIIQ